MYSSKLSTLSFVIPEELQTNIQSIRKFYDKAYTYWPPHINFLFPFIPENMINEDIIMKLKEALRPIKPFKAEFEDIHFFNFGKNKPITIWLGPKDTKPFEEIYNTVSSVFPNLKDKRHKKFVPHITLAQQNYFQFNKCSVKYKKQIGHIECIVNSIQILTRNENEPFKPLYTIYFEGKEPSYHH